MDKIPVTCRALIQRINRLLSKENKQLMAYRGKQARGRKEFYVIDKSNSEVCVQNCTLENMATKTGAMKGYEVLV